MDKNKFARKARKWRKKQKLTNQEAAQLLGLSTGTVSQVERGKITVTARIYMAYHLQAAEIFPMTAEMQRSFVF